MAITIRQTLGDQQSLEMGTPAILFLVLIAADDGATSPITLIYNLEAETMIFTVL